jgi:nucleotide-binding universal stress UspA family protein
MKRWERAGMMLLAAVLILIWLTIAWEKPWALAFATSIVTAGLSARWAAHNRQRIREWFLAPVPTFMPTVELPGPPTQGAEPAAARAEVARPAPAVQARVMVATRWNPRMVRFALEEARHRSAELFVLFVRQLAVTPMGSVTVADASQDADACAVFDDATRGAQEAGVPIQLLYAVTNDVPDTILDFAVTHGVDLLVLGTTHRGKLWRTMRGDVIQQVAQYLPESTELLIRA